VRVFRTRSFTHFAERAGIGDDDLLRVTSRLLWSGPDTELGSDVFDQRVDRRRISPASDARVVVALRSVSRAVFLHGYAAGRGVRLTSREKRAFRDLARLILDLDDTQTRIAIETGELIEVAGDVENPR
jgi:hypothetical protein